METLGSYPIIFSTVSTIIVAAIAATLSYMAGRATKNHEWRLMILRENVAKSRSVYIDFIMESDRTILISYDEKISKVGEFVELGRKFSAIQIFSSDPVIEAAKVVFSCVLSAHSVENKKHDYNKSKMVFIRAVRDEVKALEKI